MAGTEPIRPVASAFDPRAEAAARVVQQDAERDTNEIDQQTKQKKARAQQQAVEGKTQEGGQAALPRQAFDVFIHRDEDTTASRQDNQPPQDKASSEHPPSDNPSPKEEEEEASLPLVQPDVALQINPPPEALKSQQAEPQPDSAPEPESPPPPDNTLKPEPPPPEQPPASATSEPKPQQPLAQPPEAPPVDESPQSPPEPARTSENQPSPATPSENPPQADSSPEPQAESSADASTQATSQPPTQQPDKAIADKPALGVGDCPDWQQLFRDRYKPQVLHLNQAMATLIDWHEHRQQGQWGSGYPAPLLDDLWKALRHATLLGGKRFRPILIFESATALGLSMDEVTGLACAVECIHGQSLVFDDLPALDNDDLRRGQPTVHKAFDEATAILVADGLACMAFGTMAQWGPDHRLPADKGAVGLELVRQLSDVASLQGLVNGQFADLRSVGQADSDAAADQSASDKTQGLQQLRYIQANKTAALIRFCLRAPGILAGASGEVVHQLDVLGSYIGELFQVVDDLLDVRGSRDQLGKTPGKDEAQQKLTATRLMGVEAADQHARDLVKQADQLIDELAPRLQRVDGLRFLCHYGLWRLH